MADLNWRHHTIIQALISRGPLEEKELHSIFSEVTGKNPATQQQHFNDMLLKINKELSYVQFELRGCRNQYDGNVFYGVVNNMSDEQSKLGTRYSVPQIAFYKGVIEAIVQDVGAQGSINSIKALNIRLENQVQAGQVLEDSQSRISPVFKSFSMAQREKTLFNLIQDDWLSAISEGKIGLGVRSFLDLRSWFRSNDIPSCGVCNEAAVKAVLCPNEACSVRIHGYCVKKKFSKRKVARVCPGCGTEWHPPECGEEEEDEEEEEPNKTSQTEVLKSSAATRKRLRSLKTETVEAAQTQNHIPSRPSMRQRLRSCKREAANATEAESSQASVESPNLRKNRRSEAGSSQASVQSHNLRKTRRSARA